MKVYVTGGCLVSDASASRSAVNCTRCHFLSVTTRWSANKAVCSIVQAPLASWAWSVDCRCHRWIAPGQQLFGARCRRCENYRKLRTAIVCAQTNSRCPRQCL